MEFSFVQATKGRLHHLKQTLLPNIANILSVLPQAEFVLVNMYSPDDTHDWLLSEAKTHLKNGELKYYRATEPFPEWNYGIAFNAAVTHSTGSIVSIIQSDNFVSPEYISSIVAMIENHVFICGPQDTSDLSIPNGLRGLQTLHRDDFNVLNGFSEDFMAWGFHDTDLEWRARKLGLKIKHWDYRQVDRIDHGNEERQRYCEFEGETSESNRINRIIAESLGSYIANDGKVIGNIKTERILI